MIKKILILTLILTAFQVQNLNAQLWVKAVASQDTVCAGTLVNLTAQVPFDTLLYSNFNTQIAGNMWDSIYCTPDFSNPCGPGPDSTYIWMGGDTNSVRFIETKAAPFISPAYVYWNMRFGRSQFQGKCEAPDQYNEAIYLEYKTPYKDWTSFPGLFTPPFGPNSTHPPFITLIPGQGGHFIPEADSADQLQSTRYYWHKYRTQLPGYAYSPATKFRFIQYHNSGAGHDSWGIDNVLIGNPIYQGNFLWSNTGSTNFIYFTAQSKLMSYDTCFSVKYNTINAGVAYDTICIHIKDVCPPMFGVELNTSTFPSITFTDTTNCPNAIGNEWIVNQDTLYNRPSVSYPFSITSVYKVQLKIITDCGAQTTTKIYDLLPAGMQDELSGFSLHQSANKVILKNQNGLTNFSLDLYNSCGQKIKSVCKSCHQQSIEFPISHLPKGVYVLHLQHKNGNYSFKIIR